jgi:hypothetical protein
MNSFQPTEETYPDQEKDGPIPAVTEQAILRLCSCLWCHANSDIRPSKSNYLCLFSDYEPKESDSPACTWL